MQNEPKKCPNCGKKLKVIAGADKKGNPTKVCSCCKSNADMSALTCISCGSKLVICPHCYGEDPYGGQGQAGYLICQNEDCEEHEFCCGC